MPGYHRPLYPPEDPADLPKYAGHKNRKPLCRGLKESKWPFHLHPARSDRTRTGIRQHDRGESPGHGGDTGRRADLHGPGIVTDIGGTLLRIHTFKDPGQM